jgi:hypothetical protein
MKIDKVRNQVVWENTIKRCWSVGLPRRPPLRPVGYSCTYKYILINNSVHVFIYILVYVYVVTGLGGTTPWTWARRWLRGLPRLRFGVHPFQWVGKSLILMLAGGKLLVTIYNGLVVASHLSSLMGGDR